jgi:hypothetical protein
MKKLPKDLTEMALNFNDTKDRYEFRMDIPKDVSSIYSTPKYRRRRFLLRGFPFHLERKLKAPLAWTPTSSARSWS